MSASTAYHNLIVCIVCYLSIFNQIFLFSFCCLGSVEVVLSVQMKFSCVATHLVVTVGVLLGMLASLYIIDVLYLALRKQLLCSFFA